MIDVKKDERKTNGTQRCMYVILWVHVCCLCEREMYAGHEEKSDACLAQTITQPHWIIQQSSRNVSFLRDFVTAVTIQLLFEDWITKIAANKQQNITFRHLSQQCHLNNKDTRGCSLYIKRMPEANDGRQTNTMWTWTVEAKRIAIQKSCTFSNLKCSCSLFWYKTILKIKVTVIKR